MALTLTFSRHLLFKKYVTVAYISTWPRYSPDTPVVQTGTL